MQRVRVNGLKGARSGFGRRRGFTLIEVMIVILIVLALGGLVAYNLVGTKKEADAGVVKIQMDNIGYALKQFNLKYGRYPSDEEGLRVLWDKSALTDENEAKNWTKYLEEPIPNDKWGSPWGYRQKSEHLSEDMYDLWSFGPDKQEGTEDDITSWAGKSSGEGDGASAPSDGGSAPSGS